MLLSDLEVADLLSCSRATVWRRVADNTLPAPLKIGGMSRFVLSEILERLPLDVCVLGMGDDMHTASLFPGSPELARALAPEDGTPVMAVTAPGAPEPRVTLTAPVLAGAVHVYLLIKGAAKRAALERALATGDPNIAPIRAVLDAAAGPVVFYADE